MSLYRYSSALPDFENAFLCIAVEVGLEKRRYLLFATEVRRGFLTKQSEGQASKMCRLIIYRSLVSATFFTERERPTEIVMHKRRTVFSRV